MKNLLHIDSSLFRNHGVSHQLALELIEELEKQHDTIAVKRRDLSGEAIPHVDGAWVQAHSTAISKRSSSQQSRVDFSAQLVAEVQDADLLVIGAPMYNFSVPSVLKAWFDHIAQAGVTFRYTAEGPEGMLKNKTAYVVSTRGGIHKDTPSDSQIPVIKNILGLMGITDVRVIYAEGLNISDSAREQGMDAARTAIQQIAQ